jgi:hypothetical protein
MNQARKQKEAVMAIGGSGGTVTYDYGCDGSGTPIPFTPPLVPRLLRKVLGTDFFANAVGIALEESEGVGVEDAELLRLKTHLTALPNLKTLSITGSPITNAGLEAVEGLSPLQHESLRSTRVGDAGLLRLHGLEQLRTLIP